MKLSYWLGYSTAKTVARAFFNYRVIGDAHLKLAGGALVVSNHESFLDPPLVGIAFDEEMHFLARKTLFNNPIARVVYQALNSIPVDQDRPDMTSLKTVIRLLKEGQKVVIFPEGSRTLDGNLLPGEPGVGLIVAKAGVPVLPVRIFGARKALPRGGTLPQPSEITLVVGQPWTYDPANYRDHSGKDLYKRISEDLMAQISELHL